MKNETMRWLKSQFKGKISITKGVIIAFMITGSIFTYAVDEQPEKPTLSPIDITINNYGEQTGLELGDNSRARGVGSVSTGRNGMAIGKNAVATGENETKESIERKLEENRQKLQEIADAKKVIADKAEELRLKQIRERETIEAGIRVEEIQKSKEKARLAWENKKQELATKTEESKEFFREHQVKIDTLNSKLRGLENLTGVDFSSDEGLNHTADLLKAKVEDGTQLNLSHDFYLDYVKTYYKALGDLRNNNTFKDKNYNTVYGLTNNQIINPETNGLNHLNLDFNYNTNDIIIPNSYYSIFTGRYDNNSSSVEASSTTYSTDYNNSYISRAFYSSTAYLSISTPKVSVNSYLGSAASYNFLGVYELGKFDNDTKNIHRKFLNTAIDDNSIYRVKDKNINTYVNINTDITSEQEFNDWNSVKDEWKKRIKSYNAKLGDELIGKLDTLTGGKSTILYNMVTDMKFELVDLDKQITYYQGQYEKTKDVSWLDKKKKALDIRTERIANNETRLKDKARELGYTLNDTKDLNMVLGHPYWEKWVKENITDIMEKNKLTTNTLTRELEQALGINKNAVLEKQKELAKLGEQVDQAKRNYEGLNPTESDMILAREYQRVKEEINRLTTDLKNAETRKDNLEKALTLHNLKNVGENQIAFGTDTLAVGNNAIAMGYKSITVGTDSVNIGARGQATGTSITQLGQDLVTNGNNNISIGNTNVINGENNIVFGRNNNIGALGDTNKSNGNIVLGSRISISKDITNSITLGDGSTAISNAISVGSTGAERKIVNVADGKISETSKEAINGSQLFTLENKIKNIKTSISKEELDTKLNKDGTGLSESERAILLQNLGLDNIATNINLENKANKDGSNIEIDKYIAKLNVGANIETPTDKLVKDSDVKKYLDSNYTKSSDLEDKFNTKANKSDLDNKLNVDVSNLSDKGKENLIKKIGNGNLDKPIGELVTDTIIKEKLDIKLNKDFSNLSYSDKESIRNNIDVYSKSETDNRILESEKKMAAGMANSIAHANVPQVSENYLFALGAGTGYYNGESAVALGISGQTKNKRVVYKLNVGIDTKTKVSVGAGINVNLGIIEEPKQEIKEVPLAPIIYNNKEVKDLERKNKELEERLNELSKLLKDFTSKKEVKTEKILLSNFDFDKYELKESHKNQLDSILEKEFSIIIITGYTDEKGTVEYNQVLSEKRAKAVYDYLKEKGINRDIYYLGKGETSLLSSIDDSLNRRVEISIR